MSNDLLVRLRRGGATPDPVESEEDVRLGSERLSHAENLNPSFSAPSLVAVADDPDVYESLSLLKADAIPEEILLNFAARHKSTWALDIIAERASGGMFDWPSIRMSAIRFAKSAREFDPVLDRVPIDALWHMCQALHERGFDLEAEKALLSFIATRFRAGRDVGSKNREDFMEALIAAGDPSAAETCFPRLSGANWRQHALAVELEHPRFGGDFEMFLTRLNQGLRRFGLEPLALDGGGQAPFERLVAQASGAGHTGPLVSIIMTTDRPDSAALSAAKSIVNQSYENWELLVLDDASPSECSTVLDQIAGLDNRIHVIRAPEPKGAYACRNEAMRVAEGEFVTFQTAREWSHPRRLELQVRDLVSFPRHIANTVRGARVTTDLSLVGRRGARLMLSEPSLMFRRAEAMELVGYFDTTLKGAGIEYRTRLEAATGTKIGWVGPEAPLQLLLDPGTEDDELNFGLGVWMSDAWLAYRGAIRRFHKQIQAGERSSLMPYPQEERLLVAPSVLLSGSASRVQADVLVVMDAHQLGGKEAYIQAVADEIETAVEDGLSVALLHVDAPYGVRNAGPIAERLQELIDDGVLQQVFASDQVYAGVVIVRQAGAAQGHVACRLPVETQRVVVVQDSAAGDIRGETIARSDVSDVLRGWFGKEPEWTVAPPLAPRPTVVSAVVESQELRVSLKVADPERIDRIRIGRGVTGIDANAATNSEGYVVAAFPLADLPQGDVAVSAVRALGDSGGAIQRCWVAGKPLLSRQGDVLVLPNRRGGLSVTSDHVASAEYAREYLNARVTRAEVYRGGIQLGVEADASTELAGVLALREVDGRVRERKLVEVESSPHQLFEGEIADLLDTRWKLFGMFRTEVGLVCAPLDFGDATVVKNSPRYRIRKLSDDGVGVLHVVRQTTAAPDQHEPVLSIVMPVYNVAPFLDTSIQSVLSQGFKDFELIIIDDASSDGGRKIIEMYRELDPRIRVIELDHNTLGGAGVPSNLGLKSARGKYIAFVDSDDWVTHNGLAKLVEIAEANDAELVIGDFRTFDQDSRTVSEAYDSVRWRGIPLLQVISGESHPGLFRLSPVPWRKLYRRDFVERSHALYPEGDFFYEDNPLHWRVLARAQRIVACDEVVSYHRMEREGQTMAAHAYKLGAIASHANTILNSLIETNAEHRELLFEEFVDYVSRQRWIVRKQTQPAAADMIKTRLVRIYDKGLEAEPRTVVPEATRAHFSGYRDVYPELDLTIIIPVYNSADLLKETLDSVLRLKGLNYDVLLIDDGSEDASLKVMHKYESAHANVHVFEQKNRGAGRARNAVIPLATGRYTYFLDADDVIDPDALVQAVNKADAEGTDLMFVKYRIDFPDEKRSRGMFDADRKIWEELLETHTNEERQRLVAKLINYPWNRVIRTDLLHDANIFFGPTVVHNDILYHWHSILAARHIGFFDGAICSHRKFKDRVQVTNIQDERRMGVLEAVRGTHQRISEFDSYRNIRNSWTNFSKELLTWAQSRIPEGLLPVYQEMSDKLMEEMQK